MLESVVWGYLGPLGLCLALIELGANVDDAGIPILTMGKALYLSFVVVLYAGIYFMNKNAVKNKFVPMLDSIEQRIESLGKES